MINTLDTCCAFYLHLVGQMILKVHIWVDFVSARQNYVTFITWPAFRAKSYQHADLVHIFWSIGNLDFGSVQILPFEIQSSNIDDIIEDVNNEGHLLLLITDAIYRFSGLGNLEKVIEFQSGDR